MAKRTGLGRGIGALIPTADQAERPVDVFFPGASLRPDTTDSGAAAVAEATLEAVPGIHLVQVDPHAIVPNPRQPRTHFDPEDLAELVHSVREFGCSSRWSCARTATATTNSSWGASDAGCTRSRARRDPGHCA